MVCDVMPSRKYGDENSPTSIRAALPSRFRRRSHHTSEPSATTPTLISAATGPLPSSQTRIPSTRPPMPSADRTAPTRSISRGPVYGTSFTCRVPTRTIAMITTSPANAIRHDR